MKFSQTNLTTSAPAWPGTAPAALLLAFCGAASLLAQEPVDVRLENFAVMPSTGPVVNAWIRNRTGQPLDAVVRAQWPEGWKVQPPPPLSVPPRSTAKAAFTVEQAIDVAQNAYPVTIEVEAGGRVVRSLQEGLVATAPYLKPSIDGLIEDWKDSVPIRFGIGGKGCTATAMSCWNRKQFCLAVQVEDERLGASADGLRRDAIQFALTPSPAGGASAMAPGPSPRYEFVVIAGAAGPAPGFLILRPTDDLNLAAQERSIDSLPCPDVQAVVNRSGNTTTYELAVPMPLLPELRATPGRSFGFSLLVHDAGRAEPLDLGSVMRLWPDQRQVLSWCRWVGAAFGTQPPFDSNIEFGFSSSIH